MHINVPWATCGICGRRMQCMMRCMSYCRKFENRSKQCKKQSQDFVCALEPGFGRPLCSAFIGASNSATPWCWFGYTQGSSNRSQNGQHPLSKQLASGDSCPLGCTGTWGLIGKRAKTVQNRQRRCCTVLFAQKNLERKDNATWYGKGTNRPFVATYWRRSGYPLMRAGGSATGRTEIERSWKFVSTAISKSCPPSAQRF